MTRGRVMVDRMMKRLGLVFALALSLAFSGSAEAQLRRVLDLNRQAMEAYNNLEIEQAMQTLQEALQTAQRSNVTGSALARTYLNLGVVAIGGFGDNGQGLQYFTEALRADGSVQLDPLTSTPDIQSVFTLAQNRVGGGGNPGGTTGGTTDPGGSNTGGGSPAPPGTIPHRPWPEQLQNTALPIFVEAPASADVGDIYVYYKAPGMRDFRRMDMQRVTGGYGVELPCAEMLAPRVQYYIVAFDPAGAPMGFAGSAEEPFSVSIVTARTQQAPALPGQAPPEQCSDEECPPGMAGCSTGRGNAGLGDTCRTTNECRAGLVCEDEFCVAGDGGGEDPETPAGDYPRFYVDLGFNIGLGLVKTGMRIDRSPDDGDMGREAELGYLLPGDEACASDVPDDEYCLNLVDDGLALAPGLELNLGYWVHARVGIGLFVRLALKAGEGTMSRILFGGRLQVRLTKPVASGFELVAFVGGGAGQYQVQAADTEPFAISGLTNVNFGFQAAYRFTDNVGLFFRYAVHLMFPTSLFAMDPTLGLQLAF
ncbi:MAG: hypothetical protein H6724_03005 [Sandaracinus sp.]|nr:hypothetical protein [Sandaracinus sp.]